MNTGPLATLPACAVAAPLPARTGARRCAVLAAAVLALAAPLPGTATEAEALPVMASVDADALSPEHWIAKLAEPDRPILDRAGIQAQNARMRALDPSIHDLATLPDPLPRAWVRERIEALSVLPANPLYDGHGTPLPPRSLRMLRRALALEAIAPERPLHYGLVVRRADLRTFPTRASAFSSPRDTDIDRFQESALFPGDAVAVLHESRDGRWLFVASERYLAWIAAADVALGGRDAVLGYARRTPYRVATGAHVRTAIAPGEPRVSALPLEMGVRLPLRADWPPEQPVHGQLPVAAHVVELPVRDAEGRLQAMPALVPRAADMAGDYLPLTPAHLIGQAFKFLGERYGWGHAHGTRDCSGFVSEVYRSFGVLLPRNTGDQAASPALDRIAFAPRDGHAARMAAVRALRPGDLVYIPGHVLMAIGRQDGMTYVIHDIHGGRWRAADGTVAEGRLNGVVVTPLEPMLAGDGRPYVDHMVAIQRIRPAAAP
ncbi:SH3 domain-containing protein [Pseudoxanthomonas broegbernensis]|nr:SH3 domain-containing protein [Pseudoxanthomonas broegbernensis]MBB6065623.1 hypothetical protein [Pseudoxanthomonas broegbernensis]